MKYFSILLCIVCELLFLVSASDKNNDGQLSSGIPTENPSTTTSRISRLKPILRINPGDDKPVLPRTRKPFITPPQKPSSTVGPPVSIFRQPRTRLPSITSSTTHRPFQQFSTIRVHYASRMPGMIPGGEMVVSIGSSKFCSWASGFECDNKEFACFNGEKCIKRSDYCDGEDDCGDNSDEEFCKERTCPESFKKCRYEDKCIPSTWFCDGNVDCFMYGNDEENCGRITKKSPESMSAADQSKFAIEKIKKWIPGQRNGLMSTAEKWGYDVDRLALIHSYTTKKFNISEAGETEMANELTIKLLSQLLSMDLSEFPSTELASYVNAFLVLCVNPRNFYGYDLVQELRNRVDKESYINPYVLLAMCNAGENITESDKKKLIDAFECKHRTFWTGTQALVVMALACADKQAGNKMDAEKLREMLWELKQQQYTNGTVVDLPTTALVLQALIAAKSEPDPDNFDQIKALQAILRSQKSDGSFGDSMTTLLVTPLLRCKSLMDINTDHCKSETRDEISALENLMKRNGSKIRVQYSIWIGEKKDLERNMVLRVPQNSSLYAVMEIAAEVDSHFKFEYSVKNDKPYISAVSDIRDNPLTGKFWSLYHIENEQPVLSKESAADLIPEDNDHFVLWYRSGSWVECTVPNAAP